MLKSTFLCALVLSCVAFGQDGPAARPRQLDQLGFLAGKWTVEMSASMPDGSTETSKGAMEGKWTLLNRHLQMSQTGTVMGQPIEGILMLSFDSVENKFVSTWFDNMTGRPLTGFGEMKDGKLVTTTDVVDFGEEMGGKMRVRMELTKRSNDAFTMKVMGGEEGKWMPFFTSEYKRAK